MESILYVSSCTGTRSRGDAPPSDTVSPALLTVSDTCAEKRRQEAIEQRHRAVEKRRQEAIERDGVGEEGAPSVARACTC